MSNVRFCIFYSDWLIIWTILYKFNIINYNPKVSILFGLIDNFIKISKDIIIKKNYVNKEFKSICIHFIIKIIEYIVLFDTSFTIHDLKFNLLMFILYNIWSVKVLNTNQLKISNIFEEKKLEDYHKINKIKLDKLNCDYKKDFEDIHIKYINKVKIYNKQLDQNKINKILTKYKNKVDKIYNNYENYLKRNIL
jgi:hypothetical protein